MTRDKIVKEMATRKRNEKDMKEHPEYFAIGPLDGRYAKVQEMLSPYFSEFALMKYRVKVEIKWLIYFIRYILVSGEKSKYMKDRENVEKIYSIYKNFSIESMLKIKEIEAKTNHDVKSVEIFIGNELKEMGLDELVSLVHIGCTSEDINNLAYAMMISEGIENVWIPQAEKLILVLEQMTSEYVGVPMLAHTHGQKATPTTVGKEIYVFAYRLSQVLKDIEDIKYQGKFNGATGNYSALSVAFPDYNWPECANEFVEELELEFNPITTQIEPHDYIVKILDMIRHFNNIVLDLDWDMWSYISRDYFKQVVVKEEVGSSTMPHKVNPIRFENSISNIDMSNAICVALSNKLPVSRMQRDLSDSSSMRNIGLPFGYSIQAISQTIGGLKKVTVNEEKLQQELEESWEVLAEPIQTMLRKYGIMDAYDELKKLTRGKQISKETIQQFVDGLEVLSEEDKESLLTLTPSLYTGYAPCIIDE